MNMKVAIVLFGLVAAVSAGSYIRNKGYATNAETTSEVEEEVKKTVAPVSTTSTKYNDDYSHSSSRTGYSSSNTRSENEKIAAEQNKNAKYSFATAFDDSIMDVSQVRQETRDGLNVKGTFSYTDGYWKRIVNYVADQDGYRVVSEVSEPIGSGPQIDLVNGKADVHTQFDGVDTQYSITAQDIALLNKDKAKTTTAY